MCFMNDISDVDKLKVQVKLLLELINVKLFKGLSTPDGLVVGPNIHILRKLEDDIDNNSLEELLTLYECDIMYQEVQQHVNEAHAGYCIGDDGCCQRCRIDELLDRKVIDDTHKDTFGLTEKSSRKLSRDMMKSLRDTNYRDFKLVKA